MMNINETLDQYNELYVKITDYFGYVDSWLGLSIEDCRGFTWQLTKHGVYYTDSSNIIDVLDDLFAPRVVDFKQEWVYRGEELTLLVLRFGLSGNAFLGVFDNNKEIKNEQFTTM
jgi:hypothetical protein